MTKMISADSLHRLVKQAIDSGAAASVAEAQALFQGFRLAITFTPDVVIRVYVNSPRKSGFIEADAQGNVLEVNVS